MMTISEFYKLIFENQEGTNNEYEKNQDKMLIEETFLHQIVGYLKGIKNVEEQKKNFVDIVKKPSMDNGKVYEFLVYAWLRKNGFKIEEQVYIKQEECLKKNDYYADGCFEDIIFDVKKFGIGFPSYEIFKNKLQEEFPDHFITIGGRKNLDSTTMGIEFISKVPKWKNKLLETRPTPLGDYMLEVPEYGITIRAHNKKHSNGIYTSISEVDVTQWAEENELYFFRHASQFCIHKPYMIICPFVPKDFHFSSDDTYMYYAFRYLCRRMFMNLTKKENLLLRNYDGHAKDQITLGAAARKLSAVMFLDISDEWEYPCRCWV